MPLAEVDLATLALLSGDTARAVDLLESAIATGHPPAAQLAEVTLCGVLGTQGDFERARRLLEPALESKDPEVAPMAKASLSRLLADAGGTTRKAELRAPAAAPPDRGSGESSLFRTLRASAIAQVVPVAQLNLGRMLATKGERERARELLQGAIDSNNRNVAPMTQANIAWRWSRKGKQTRPRACSKPR